MARFIYKRDGVPVGEEISLEVQFSDSVGNNKDADDTPTIQIIDAASLEALAETSTLVSRISEGLYRYRFTIPDGYTSGLWNDIWVGTLDGYENTGIFDFTVDSVGSITPVNTVVEALAVLGDEPEAEVYTQHEIKNINKLLKLLDRKLRSTSFKPDGSQCDVFATDALIAFLVSVLDEFNATPTITGYTFADDVLVTLFKDILTQGAMLQAWSSQIPIEAGQEWQISDNGTNVIPASISAALTTMYNAQLSDYRAKLKEIKRNLRPSPLSFSSGSMYNGINPAISKMRHRREGAIIV